MRRPTSLVVDTTLNDTSSTTSSPDASTTKLPISADSSAHTVSNVPQSPQPSQPSPPQPSIRLLFSLISRRHFFILVLPALLTSMFAGGVAPFMTLVVGQVFDALSKFPTTPNPSQADKQQLLHDVGMTAIELIALAIGALALSSLTSCLWIWTGERNLLAVRKEVYTSVTRKDMIWFDTKMGEENSVQTAEGDGPVGAGGLMAKFARDTDDVRMASSLASGMLVQYLTTTITCLIIAFVRSWSLSLVILSALPAMVLIQSLSQAFVGPNLNNERTHTATAATLVDHAVSAIATVKAFNAELTKQRPLVLYLTSCRLPLTSALPSGVSLVAWPNSL
ncbi:hypothetical protein QCA50_013393 [Cerrena zonata]|uniref:ABC transmembrane type-1 domain-containing protein n=1 Tax=Cerrena zonata TaxID=2478898 RepID=A0AAW0FTW2_9APHY